MKMQALKKGEMKEWQGSMSNQETTPKQVNASTELQKGAMGTCQGGKRTTYVLNLSHVVWSRSNKEVDKKFEKTSS
jgi:hypothetical protein